MKFGVFIPTFADIDLLSGDQLNMENVNASGQVFVFIKMIRFNQD